MIDYSACKEYFEKTVEFAKSVGMHEGEDPDGQYLKRRLDYLDKYADHEGKGLTKCILRKDFAPHSFTFTMMRRVTNVEKQRELASYGAKPDESGVFWEYWFNGGLIFHGSHDNGGDGGAPTFAVNLNPHHGWGIHT